MQHLKCNRAQAVISDFSGVTGGFVVLQNQHHFLDALFVFINIEGIHYLKNIGT